MSESQFNYTVIEQIHSVGNRKSYSGTCLSGGISDRSETGSILRRR